MRGIHQIGRFVRLVRPEERDIVSQAPAEMNLIGQRNLPIRPASTTNQWRKVASSAATACPTPSIPTIIPRHCQICG